MEDSSTLKNRPEDKKEWHKQQEKILKEWGEVGASYRYMHDRAYINYNSQNFDNLYLMQIYLHEVEFLFLITSLFRKNHLPNNQLLSKQNDSFLSLNLPRGFSCNSKRCISPS